MEYIPVSTRVLVPPQDDLFAVLAESLPPLQERDIVIVTSKVVAIHEGQSIAMDEIEKEVLVQREADYLIPRPYWKTPLTITRNAFIGAGGVDESNGDGYYILLPKDAFVSAELIHTHLREQYGLAELGIVITDSASMPLRYGAKGVAIGWWGFSPLQDHIGRKDLFGREIKVERSNLVDGIAAGATVVSGEVNECIPVVIARGVPQVTFVSGDTRHELFSPVHDDVFRVLYEQWLPKE
jgi:dihydrofolate synthase / folylpolyglutamate synthase